MTARVAGGFSFGFFAFGLFSARRSGQVSKSANNARRLNRAMRSGETG
jgi:hypothetical protein